MNHNRIDQRFERDRKLKRPAFVPYFTAGFPDVATSVALIRRADELGASVVEIGMPFSDSIADGPVIQESFNHCLAGGYRAEHAFEIAATARPHVDCGLVAMVSYSVVHRLGLPGFMKDAAEAGFDGVILPDVPLEECAATSETVIAAGLCPIGLVAPRTRPSRALEIAKSSRGFLYRIAVAGTTGERSSVPDSLASEVSALRSASGLPVCVGFGIATAEHVRTVTRIADGVIVGSAIIRRIGDAMRNGSDSAAIVETVSAFMTELMTGLDRPAA